MSGPSPDDVRALDRGEARSLLAHIGLDPELPHSLETLQWAYICGSSFHNLDLLARTAPRSPEECIRAILAGSGGTCHALATGFLALLRGLGFDAHLAAARISERFDHLVVVAHVGGRSFVCDVGNGHPYRRPFPLDESASIDHLGWRFEAEPNEGGLRLRRRLDDGRWRVVYTVDPQPRSYQDFVPSIAAHHERVGFGPFLSGLRAVLIRDDVVVTVRDLSYARYSAAGKRERRVRDLAAMTRILRRTFRFDDHRIEAAIERIRPAAETWASTPGARPRIVVALSATDRPASLARLISSLELEWSRHGRDEGLSVIVIENSSGQEAREANRRTCAEHARSLDVHLLDDGRYGRAIAESRIEQTLALAEMHARGDRFDIVWMLDDDVVLEQLVLQSDWIDRRADIRYFEEIERRFDDNPEISVLIGGVCGDPPIRPEAVLQTQLFDLISNLERFMSLSPDAPYRAPAQRVSFSLPDFYYDHSQAGLEHLELPFHWIGRHPNQTVRQAARGFAAAMEGSFAGSTPTRPLLHRAVGSEDPRDCVLRGGNTVFLDLDALFRHSYPSVALDGVRTRRSDMLGASRLASSGETWIASFDCPVLHLRDSQTPNDASLAEQREHLWASIIAELGGVMLSRLQMRGLSPEPSLIRALVLERVELLLDRLCRASELAHEALASVARARRTWMGDDVDVSAGLDRVESALRRAQALYFGGDAPAEWFASLRTALMAEEVWRRIHTFASDEIETQCRAQLERVCDKLGRRA